MPRLPVWSPFLVSSLFRFYLCFAPQSSCFDVLDAAVKQLNEALDLKKDFGVQCVFMVLHVSEVQCIQ